MIRFCFEAAIEIEDVIDWYLPRSFDVAERFHRALSDVLREIESDPARFARIHLDAALLWVSGSSVSNDRYIIRCVMTISSLLGVALSIVYRSYVRFQSE